MTTLVVTDLDGTLWDHSLQCHPQVLAAVHDLLGRDNVELMVATGRRRNSARRAFVDNGIMLPSVLLNGAIGFDFEAEHIFHQRTFGNAALRELANVLTQHSLAPVAYLSDTRALVVDGVTTSDHHLETLQSDMHRVSFAELVERSDVLGMSMLGIEKELVEPALGDLEALAGVKAAAFADQLYAPFSLMIAPENITKEAGITAYLDYRGLTPDRIIALGDGGNDLEMLAMADIALVVEDGDARALALATHVIKPPHQAGWASVLDYL